MHVLVPTDRFDEPTPRPKFVRNKKSRFPTEKNEERPRIVTSADKLFKKKRTYKNGVSKSQDEASNRKSFCGTGSETGPKKISFLFLRPLQSRITRKTFPFRLLSNNVSQKSDTPLSRMPKPKRHLFGTENPFPNRKTEPKGIPILSFRKRNLYFTLTSEISLNTEKRKSHRHNNHHSSHRKMILRMRYQLCVI